MASFPGRVTNAAANAAVLDSSPLIRRATTTAVTSADANVAANILSPLLIDPLRAVRIEAAAVLAGTTNDILPATAATELAKSIDEYVLAQRLSADRPEAHLNLGLLYAKESRFNDAETELKTALSLDSSFAPAAVNLADLDRELGHEDEGESILRAAIARSPSDASLQDALGLSLVRQGRGRDAIADLATAARLDPANARFNYVYAVALNDAGKRDKAIETLKKVLLDHPYDRDILAALVSFDRDAGNSNESLKYAARLRELQAADR
jgi:tetratricopeptide (TPR) repeat protein